MVQTNARCPNLFNPRAACNRVRALALVLALATALGALAPAAQAARSPLTEARSGLDTLATLHDAAGRFDPAMAPPIVEAAVAVGTDPAFWPNAEHPVLASLRPADNGTLLSQVRAIRARALAGHGTPDDVATIQASFRNGQFGDPVLLNDDMWALRAIHALGAASLRDYARAAATRLAGQQDASGGWSWLLGGVPSSDVTGMAAVALQEAGVLPSETAAKARAYLAARQNATSGGYAQDAGAANCDSTVWAIRGLDALGAPVPAPAWAYLAGLHQPDGGFAYQPSQASNAFCTAEVATLLGDWSQQHRDLSAYAGGGTQRAPAAGLTLAAAALWLALLSRRAPWAPSPPRTAPRSPPPAAR
jgi:hypothetical protein